MGPPTLFVQAGNDYTARVSNCLVDFQALKDATIQPIFILLKQGGHGSVFVRRSSLPAVDSISPKHSYPTRPKASPSETQIPRARQRSDARSPEEPVAKPLPSAPYSTFSIVCDLIRAGSN